MWNERNINEHIDWILAIERKLPVEEWTIDGVHIWPLLRMRLNFLFFVAPQDTGKPTVTVSKRTSLVSRLLKEGLSLLRFIISSPDKTPVVGADFAAHRSMFNGKLFDKYFDPIFDAFEPRFHGLIVEYQRTDGLAKTDYYKPERIVRFYEFRELLQLIGLLKARATSANFQLPGYEEFLGILQKEKIDTTNYTKENVRKTIAVIRSLKWFWKKLYKKTGAKVAIGLCYYTEPLYAMILAANETGVISVDLQHGGQGKNHLGYARFLKMPKGGSYDLLPRYFWCWDDPSASEIQNWITSTGAKHKVIQEGHPWFEYLGNLKWPSLDGIHNLVVLTLQPYDNTLSENPIYDVVAETIKMTSKEFKWFVRLHPRQLHLRSVLKDQLNSLGVLNDVEVDVATDLPMPAILSRAAAHITRSSGSAIEAALLGVQNVIIDDHGAVMFEDYIKEGKATLYLGNDPNALAGVIRSAVAKQTGKQSNAGNNDWEFILHLD
jgi:hypothetical protein